MAQTMINIPGVIRPVEARVGLISGRPRLSVDGQSYSARQPRSFYLPGENGTSVTAWANADFFEAYPTITIGYLTFPAGPPNPVLLRALVFLPLVMGILFGIPFVLLNLVLIRTGLHTAVKAILCVLSSLTLPAAIVITMALAAQ